MENMTTTTVKSITAEEYSKGQREYWSQVAESDGFDIEDVSVASGMNGMITGIMPYDCQHEKDYPYPVLANLYGKVGLHRYNMFEGTSFELAALVKLNMFGMCVSSYYMTLLAHDPAAGALQKTFQIRIDEKNVNVLDLTVSVARIKHKEPKDNDDEVTTKRLFIPHFDGGASGDGLFKGELPEWPSDDALNDGTRFYVVKESEWQATGWVFLYLELVICASNKYEPNRDFLSKLEIVKVAIETSTEDEEPLNERLKAKSANVYIMFKGLAEARYPRHVFEIGEHVERKAIVRRVIDEHTGDLTLVGKLYGGVLRCSPAPCNREKKQSSKKRPRGTV